MYRMKDIYFIILGLFVGRLNAIHDINAIIEKTRQQVGYGLQHHVESQYDTVEYTEALDLEIRNGIKSLMVKQSHLTSDFTKTLPKVSSACANDTVQMFRDIINGTQYALNMLDADGKPGSGIQHGNIIWLGNLKQCQESVSFDGRFKGQMCEVFTNVGIPQLGAISMMRLTFDGCFPDSCSETDVQLLSWDAMQRLDEALKLKIYPLAVQCPEDLEYSVGDKAALVVCGIIGFALVLGTLAEIVFMCIDNCSDGDEIKTRKENPSQYASIGVNVNDPSERIGLLSNVPKPETFSVTIQSCSSTVKQILLSFSLITNTRKLLNTTTASGSLTAINGMRVISMWWVILGHTFGFTFSMTDNILDMIYLLKRFTFQAVMNGTYSVDTFFFMSGLLVSYTVLKKLKSGGLGSVNWAIFYIHRFWRLTPVYAFAIMIWTTLYRHWIWNGPYSLGFTRIKPSQFDICDKYWWTNILYINNFHPNLGNIQKQCFGWGWYLANDMQFYILSPLFLILLHQKKKLGHAMMLFFLFGCLTSRIITADYYGMRLPGINQPINHTNESWASSSPLYNKPYTRLPVYLVGIWVGYLLVLNSNRVRINKIILTIGWCLAITIGISVIYGLYGFYKDIPTMHEGGKAQSLIYIGFSRFAWSLALAWVVFVCAVGYGGPVDKFLSWKVWAPLGRLTYCAYLVHPAVIFYFDLNMEKPLHYTDLVFIQQYISMVVVSYGVAFVLSMAVEAPMLALEKVIFRRWSR